MTRLLGALSVLVVALASWVALRSPLGPNQATYHLIGHVVAGGGRPYADAHDLKGPLGLLVYSLPAVAGFPYRWLDLAVAGAGGALVFRFVRRAHPPEVSAAAAAFAFASVRLDGPENTGDVTQLLGLAVTAALLVPSGPWIGVLAGLAAFVKTSGPLYFAGLLFRERRLVALVAVGACGWALLAAFGLFVPALEATVLDPLLYHLPVGGPDLRALASWLAVDPLVRVGGPAGLAVLWRRGDRIAGTLFLGVLLESALEQRFWPYHLAPLLPLCAVGLAALPLNRAWLLVPLVSLAVRLVLLPAGYSLPDVTRLAAGRAALAQCVPAGGTLQVLGSDPLIYLERGALPVCRLHDAGFVFRDYTGRPLPAHRLKWRSELAECVGERRPDWVVVDPELRDAIDLDGWEREEDCGGWQVFRAPRGAP